MLLPNAMKSYRIMVISDALNKYNYNHAAAARALGMKKTTLDYSAPERKMK
jgi:transcriptional regulator with GAF, ATPase, and Fis domain